MMPFCSLTVYSFRWRCVPLLTLKNRFCRNWRAKTCYEVWRYSILSTFATATLNSTTSVWVADWKSSCFWTSGSPSTSMSLRAIKLSRSSRGPTSTVPKKWGRSTFWEIGPLLIYTTTIYTGCKRHSPSWKSLCSSTKLSFWIWTWLPKKQDSSPKKSNVSKTVLQMWFHFSSSSSPCSNRIMRRRHR